MLTAETQKHKAQNTKRMQADLGRTLRKTLIRALLGSCLFSAANSFGQSTVVKSFSKNSSGVTFRLSQGILEVQVCTERIIHIVYTLQDDVPAPTIEVVNRKWAAVPFHVSENRDFVRISTAKMTVNVQRISGRLSFLDSKGAVISQEPATGGRTLTPTVVAGQNTWQPQQTFLSPPDEAFYGLGQHQEGFFNWRGIPLRLQQVDANIAMPVVLSSRGYGLLWNSAALTDFNPADQPVNIDPITKTGTFKSGEQGTYGFLATGGTGREHIGIKLNGEAIAGLDGYLVPYATSGVSTLKPNRTYTVKMEGAGDSAAVYVRPPSDTVGFRSELGDAVDYYFMYGPNLNDVVAEYREATGATPLFPKWAYGFWQCRERYSSQDQLLAAAAEFRQRNIPVDVMVQDWQYWGRYGWNAMKFDEKNYPDPAVMIHTLHAESLHFVISVWSKFDPQTEISREMKSRGLLVSGSDWFDAFNPQARELYWSSIRTGLFRFGVDGWWLDATEPEWDPLKNQNVFTGLGNFVRNAYPLFVTKAVYEGQRAAAPENRVVILTRSAYLGEQRNAAATWSGDIASTWDDFRHQISAGLGLTMAGIPYWTTDVGGFNRPDDQYQSPSYHELLTRWFEYGVFCPLFRVHGNNSRTEIWNYGPEVESTFRRYDELRYRLFPYIYSTAWKTTHDGYNLMRALPLDYTGDPEVANISDEFMFGPSLLVSPISSSGAHSRLVYLPKEPEWIDFWTGKTEAGGRTITAHAPLDRIPLYVKAGSILPMGPVRQYASEKQDPIELRIYPGQDGTFALYDDHGDNYNYEKGEYAQIPIRWNESSGTLTIGPRAGDFPGMSASIEFRIVLVGQNQGTGFEATERPNSDISFRGPEINIQLKGK